MSLAVAIQMDPIEAVDINADSTFALALEAQDRGHALYHYLARGLAFRSGRLAALARPLTVRRKKGNHFSLGEVEELDLALMDVVLMRQDPPFDMAYITATHLLEHIHPKTLVVNDPFHVRNAPEKLFVTHFGEFMPPTLITSEARLIDEFRVEHGDIILKPIYGNGGAGVFHIAPRRRKSQGAPGNVHRALPRADYHPALCSRGPRGATNGSSSSRARRSGRSIGSRPEGEARSNMHVGGVAVATTLSARDKEICQAIGPALEERGIVFAGIDVIGDYMTEINVTSPTGLQEIDRFDGVCLEARVWGRDRGPANRPPIAPGEKFGNYIR